MDMKTDIIRVHGRSFVAVRNTSDLLATCEGCAAASGGPIKDDRARRELCLALPRCYTAEDGAFHQNVVFQEVDLGPMTTAHPKEEARLLTEDPDHGDSGVPDALAHKPVHGGYAETPMPLASAAHDGTSGMAQRARAEGMARTTDPQTSHDAAAKVGGGKLIDLILSVMSQPVANEAGLGWTGKELAEYTGRPLNSVTPRFAQLRRMGLIHPAGRRDKQIVWKLGNGVAA